MSTRWRLEAGSVGSSQGLQPRGWKHGAGRGVVPRVQKCDGHHAEGGLNRQAGMLATPDALTHGPSAAPHTCPIPALSLALFAPSPAREGSSKTAHPIGPQSSVCHSDWSRRLTPPLPAPRRATGPHHKRQGGDMGKCQHFCFGLRCPVSHTCRYSALKIRVIVLTGENTEAFWVSPTRRKVA